MDKGISQSLNAHWARIPCEPNVCSKTKSITNNQKYMRMKKIMYLFQNV